MIPRPIALGLTICEKAIVEERTRNLTLVSCFTKLIVEDFPSPPQRFALFAVLTDGLGNGKIDLVVTRVDNDREVYNLQYPVYFRNRREELRLVLRINQCSFPEPGKYQITLFVDGDWIAHRELNVVEREEQP
jgi:hypothetical protein